MPKTLQKPRRPRGDAHSRVLTAHTLLGVDVGYTHLALALVTVAADYTQPHVSGFALINLAAHVHRRVPASACRLHHSAMTADKVAHVVQEFAEWIAEAEEVVIERQPPGGMTDVEQLLVAATRDKARLLAPRTMHAHLGLSRLDYEQRKHATEAFACALCPALAAHTGLRRKHDIADAVCLAVTRAAQRSAEQRARAPPPRTSPRTSPYFAVRCGETGNTTTTID